jgi:hypothetical protein
MGHQPRPTTRTLGAEPGLLALLGICVVHDQNPGSVARGRRGLAGVLTSRLARRSAASSKADDMRPTTMAHP